MALRGNDIPNDGRVMLWVRDCRHQVENSCRKGAQCTTPMRRASRTVSHASSSPIIVSMTVAMHRTSMEAGHTRNLVAPAICGPGLNDMHLHPTSPYCWFLRCKFFLNRRLSPPTAPEPAASKKGTSSHRTPASPSSGTPPPGTRSRQSNMPAGGSSSAPLRTMAVARAS